MPRPSPTIRLRSAHRRCRALLAALLAPAAPGLGAGAPAHAGEERAGWVEWVRVEPGRQELKAKLDTGARTSSLSALDLEVVETLDGVDRVRFRLEGPEGDGSSPWVERPVVRWVRIKRHDARPDRRPVVEMEICLGGTRRAVETSLADRRKFNYPVLLGRNFLAGAVLVDAGATFTRGHCAPGADAPQEPTPDTEGEEEEGEEEVGEEPATEGDSEAVPGGAAARPEAPEEASDGRTQ